jgi:rhamnose transport system ATP-binding protein
MPTEAPPSPNGIAKALSCEGVNLSFAGFQVLKDVSFCLQPGRIHAITGENGAGKSSLAKILAGIYHADSGSVLLGDEQLRLNSPKAAQHAGISLIHQEPLPFEELTVAESILAGNLPTRYGLVDWPAVRQKAKDTLEGLGISLDVTRKAEGLSIADQQLLELACAMALDARYLIFDETTAPLTPNETENLFKVIRRLAAEGCAIGIVTHHMHEVFEIADEITVLRDGETVAHLETSESSPSEVIHLMVGREFEARSGTDRTTGDETVLEVADLSGPGFQEVSFEVRRGEIFGLAGLVGAGRSEVTRSIFGIAPIFSGQVLLESDPLSPEATNQAMKRGLALVPEDRRASGLFPGRPVRENASVTTLAKHLSRFRLINQKSETTDAQAVLKTLNTSMRNTEQPVADLSGGNQQKVVLGRWLMSRPKVLILDEPTRGVDIGAKADVHDQIEKLASQGVSILLVSSDLPEVMALCDRVGIMRRGRLVGTLERDELTEERIMEHAAS